MKVIITGSNGLIGSACVAQLSKKHQFIPFDVSNPQNPVDITNQDILQSAVEGNDAPVVIHFAAFTDVTAAWQQNGDTDGAAYKVNVRGTQNLVDACNRTNKHLINISTAYVFDGEKTTPYTEDDQPNPIEWYGETKALAEQYISEHAQSWTTFRIDQPFQAESFSKLDLAHKVGNELKAGTLLPQFDDHFFGPTWIPDFITTLDWAVHNKPQGIFHASNGESWTNYQFAYKIGQILGKEEQVKPSKLAEYLKSNNRPYQKNTALDCSKLQQTTGSTPTPIQKALELVKY